MKPNWHRARSAFLFALGTLGIAHETLLSNIDRPSLLILFAAMIGLPAFLGKNGSSSKGADEE